MHAIGRWVFFLVPAVTHYSAAVASHSCTSMHISAYQRHAVTPGSSNAAVSFIAYYAWHLQPGQLLLSNMELTLHHRFMFRSVAQGPGVQGSDTTGVQCLYCSRVQTKTTALLPFNTANGNGVTLHACQKVK